MCMYMVWYMETVKRCGEEEGQSGVARNNTAHVVRSHAVLLTEWIAG